MHLRTRYDSDCCLTGAFASFRPYGNCKQPGSSAAQEAEDSAIRPFTISFPDEALTDLRRRINATQWPERETVTDGSQGVQLAVIQALAR
jgi:hypothetical protein